VNDWADSDTPIAGTSELLTNATSGASSTIASTRAISASSATCQRPRLMVAGRPFMPTRR